MIGGDRTGTAQGEEVRKDKFRSGGWEVHSSDLGKRGGKFYLSQLSCLRGRDWGLTQLATIRTALLPSMAGLHIRRANYLWLLHTLCCAPFHTGNHTSCYINHMASLWENGNKEKCSFRHLYRSSIFWRREDSLVNKMNESLWAEDHLPPLSSDLTGEAGSHTALSSYTESINSFCHHRKDSAMQPSVKHSQWNWCTYKATLKVTSSDIGR